MENRELKELLTALADGQSADWDALFHEVEPMVNAMCTDFFSGADIAEDAAQDICLMIYRKVALIASSDTPLQYIRRMTHNHCIDLYRRDKKQAVLNDTEPIDETMVAEPHGKSDPQNRFVAGVSDSIAEMIDTLPAPQQEVLRLKYNEDLSIREIARRLQIPEGTVSSRLYYAHHAIEKKCSPMKKSTVSSCGARSRSPCCRGGGSRKTFCSVRPPLPKAPLRLTPPSKPQSRQWRSSPARRQSVRG